MDKAIKKGVKWLFGISLGFILLLAIAGIILPETFKSLGTWGDFFGGVANPLLTFLTFIAVLVTVWLQHEELGLSRKELSRSADALERQIESLHKQNFENTFFQMLSIHNDIVNSIDLASSGKPNQYGRDCFSTFYTRLTKLFRDEEKRKQLLSTTCFPELIRISGEIISQSSDTITDIYSGLFYS
ncbi:hypothetical protein [uncultured Sphingosinicella sp.]|uniref:hypothetical protein n=1 Tax=uncultured Sphingosinicella sp. TaxID=478748 RepID=UPI0030DDD40E|tara:strand:- start:1932 stop:2489 length:558 start_codon:yes stop_codon:yes gene_type:complete